MYGTEYVEPCPYCSEALVDQVAGVGHEYEDKNCVFHDEVYGDGEGDL